jgi:hypothetical protein
VPPLNVLTNAGRSDAEYLRLSLRAHLHWLRHLGDEADLEIAVGFANRSLPHISDANTCADLRLPAGVTASAALEQVEAYYRRQGAQCLCCIAQPVLGALAAAALGKELQGRGYLPVAWPVWVLEQATALWPLELDGFAIIPARASYRHAMALLQAATSVPPAEVEAAAWLHFDDPHYDALVAIHDHGEAAAMVGMLAIGDVGMLREFHVAAAHAQGPLRQIMLNRALEIATRSLFRHVLAGGEASLTPLLQQSGFRRVGELQGFRL